VEDGVVTKLAGDPDHPITKGFLCFRTSRFTELQNSAQRLTRPLLRRGGKLCPVDMEEALDVAAERLARIREESGPAAIFHYRSGGSLGILKGLADRLFEELGPCATKIGDVCSGAGEAAQLEDFGVSDSNDVFDLLNSRHILLWGKNPKVSSVHLVPVLREAQSRGTKLVLVDPVHQQTAALADEVIQPRPGGDLDLILGVARSLFDRGLIDPKASEFCENFAAYRSLVLARTVADYAAGADVPEDVVHGLASRLAEGPVAILVGWGAQRRLHGGALVRALDALSAVSGNLFRSGGGCSFYFQRRDAFQPHHRGAEVAPRRIVEPLFGQEVLAAREPPIRAIWVTAGNPVCMLPDSARVAEAFEATEFTVVVDPFLTDTARRASLVLPVPTMLEDDDLLGAYGHHWLAESRPVVPPLPGVLHEVELLQGLAQRLGLQDFPMGSVNEIKQQHLSRVREHGVALEDLAECAVRNPRAQSLLFPEGRVRTPSGRVRLLSSIPRAPVTEGDHPLWLFSNSTSKSQSSVWAGVGLGERIWVAVHPDAAPGLTDGQEVVVESERGRIAATLRLDPRQRADVAVMPKGGHFDRGHSANSLVQARTTDIGMGAAYLDCRVRVGVC
jgi:anaerobic selenocysteine-containing dehydrogenase